MTNESSSSNLPIGSSDSRFDRNGGQFGDIRPGCSRISSENEDCSVLSILSPPGLQRGISRHVDFGIRTDIPETEAETDEEEEESGIPSLELGKALDDMSIDSDSDLSHCSMTTDEFYDCVRKVFESDPWMKQEDFNEIIRNAEYYRTAWYKGSSDDPNNNLNIIHADF